MVLAVLLEESLRVLRPHEVRPDLSYFKVLVSLCCSFLEKFLSSSPHGTFTIIHTSRSTGEPQLSPFSSDPTTLLRQLNEIPPPSSTTVQSAQVLIQWTLNEVGKYWGPAEPIYVVLFTDGRASVLDQLLQAAVEPLSLREQWPNVSLLFCSLTDNKLSQDLHRLHDHFLPRAAIFSLESHQHFTGPGSFDAVIDECAGRAVRHCRRYCGMEHDGPDVRLSCGRMNESIRLTPTPTFENINPAEPILNHPSFVVEIFGFLNASDLSNPPVASRHGINPINDAQSSCLLSLLLSSMQETRTVAMCVILLIETDSTKKRPERQPWRHGFIHPFDCKLPHLMLSVFPANCTGLPWIGQFKHLAPVEDFAGIALYDDHEGISPFPVLVPDRLSYGALAEAGSTGRAGTMAQPDPFRYVSWSSPAALLADVNKVLRLGRRLPDKSVLFFKEFNRIRSAAFAYGCPDLLEHVAKLTEAAHASELQTNSTTALAIQSHLKTMRSLIDENVCAV